MTLFYLRFSRHFSICFHINRTFSHFFECPARFFEYLFTLKSIYFHTIYFFRFKHHFSGYILFQTLKNVYLFTVFCIPLHIKCKNPRFFTNFQHGRDQISNFTKPHCILNQLLSIYTSIPVFSLNRPLFHTAPKKSRNKTTHTPLAQKFNIPPEN